MSWKTLALNPYGEHVAEDAAGHRRVATRAGWRLESEVAPARVCRVLLGTDARLAMESLAVAAISASYAHQPDRAFQIWSAPIGTPVAFHHIQPNDPRLASFRHGVERARGDAAWHALLHGRWGAPGLVPWARARLAPTGTATRGLQWGVAQRVQAQTDRARRVLEQGLAEAGEAATRWLPAPQRVVRARAAGSDTLTPEWKMSPQWTVPAVPNAPPGTQAVGQEKESFDTVVLWATGPALRALGPVPAGWWRWLSQGGQGWVVFDATTLAEEQGLRQALIQRRTPALRLEIKDGTRVQAVVWEVNMGAPAPQGVALTWDQFAPEPKPRDLATANQDVVDEFGRVPYRALSRLPGVEGVAPRRLESAMHQAFAHLGQEVGDVDGLVAQALGIPLGELGLRLSPEQVDAVAAGLRSMEDQRGFIVADETGFGKGRVMAALALIGRRRGHRVLMITENAPLFSDWYRDLDAVSDGQSPLPFLLHQAAVLRDQDGREVTRNLSATKMKALLGAPPGAEAPGLIMTTYAQVFRKQAEAKLEWVKTWLRGSPGWVLLDEAHNAAGESQVNALMESLLKEARGVVYASATFAKHEGNLSLYASALPQGRFAQTLIRRVLRGDQGLLRSTLTQAMARDGRLVRREHPPMAPPHVVWVPNEGDVKQATEAFAAAWRALGEAVDMARTLVPDSDGVWARLGAPLSRAVREFGLWTKVDPVAQAVIEAVRAGKKPVIATDSTMEAALRDALTVQDEHQVPPSLVDNTTPEEDEEALAAVPAQDGAASKGARQLMSRGRQGPVPLWKDRLRRIVDIAIPPEVWMGLPHSDPRGQALRLKLAEIQTALDSLPPWTLSPLDALRERLERAGIRCGELSGRQYRFSEVQGGWRVLDRGDPERSAQVRAFNQGDLDALIISRAGSTGISLHAGRKFQDQRPRVMVEWDISPNPAHRWQFWGRVRRRDQVCEPEFFSFWLDTPSERRIIERETRKSRQMGAHMGAVRQEPIGWVSPEGEAIVAEWAAEHDLAARRLGVAWPVVGEPTGRVERALARSPMLTETERLGLVERLARGLDLVQGYAWRKRQDPLTLPSREVRRLWWWGDPMSPASDGQARLTVRRVDAVERCWAPTRLPNLDQVKQEVAAGRGLAQGPDVLENWLQDWKVDSQRGQRPTWGRRQAWAWAQRSLPLVKTGNAIAFTSPETGATVRGVILGLDVLPADHRLSCATTPWALSQLGVRAWMVGDSDPVCVDLLTLSQDPLFRLADQPAQMAWFEVPPAPRIAVVMEGNVMAATDWGRRWAVGRSAMVWDLREGEQVVWALPSHVQFDDLARWPRDLVDTKHALQFFSRYREGHLWATLPVGQTIQAVSSHGSVLLRFNPPAYQQAKDTWLDAHAERLMFRQDRPVVASDGAVERRVSWSNLGQLMGIMETHGIGWRVDPEHLAWYRETSPIRLWEPAGKAGQKKGESHKGGHKTKRGSR